MINEIAVHFREKQLAKGDYLLKPGQTCHTLIFIYQGVLRMFNLTEKEEITLTFGSEKNFITDLTSFIHQTPAGWYIQAETDMKLLVISREDHFAMLKKYPEWLAFDNLVLANGFSILERRMFDHLYMSAEDRYRRLLSEQPTLFNRVPLQHIASMLGMKPETLSRLRKKIP